MIINDTILRQGVSETIKNKSSGPLKRVFNYNNACRIIIVGKGVKYSKKYNYTFTGNFNNNLLNSKSEINYDGTIYKGYFINNKMKEKDLSHTKEVVVGKALLKMIKKMASKYERLLKEICLKVDGQKVFLLIA